METYGMRLRRWRGRRSQRELGNAVNTEKSHISHIECDHHLGSRELAEQCDRVLGAGGELVAAWDAADAARTAVEENDMERRHLLTALSHAALATGTGVATWPLEGLRQRLGLAAGLDRSTAEWEQIAADWGRDVFTAPADELIGEIRDDLEVLQAVMDAERRPDRRRDLARTAAQLEVYLARTFGHLGRHRVARRWWRDADHLLAGTGDTALQQWVRGWNAVTGLYDGRPVTAVCDQAEADLARSDAPSVGRAQLLSVLAQGAAMLGDGDRALTALAGLADLTGQLAGAGAVDGESMHDWPVTRLRHTESFVHTLLGRLADADAAQSECLALYPAEMARDASQVQMHRAAVLARTGDGAGVTHAHQILDDLPAVDHTAYLYRVAAWVVQAAPGEPGARDLADRIRPAALTTRETM